MKRTDDRLLPVLLTCAQAVVWPGAGPVLRGRLRPRPPSWWRPWSSEW
ncbi:hypothetical protein ABT301_25250 [Streptomyces sp. NPDC000987]